MDKYAVIGLDGKLITRLNERLAIRQNVSDDALQALCASHVVGRTVFDLAKANIDNPITLQMLARVFDNLENEQQALWNFPVDPSHHRFFDMPGCTCPRMYNEKCLGTPYKIYNPTCPIHGESK